MVFGLSLAVFAVVQIALLIPDLRIAYQTPEPAYEDAFRYVAAHWQEGDVVLTMNPSAAALYLDGVDYFAMQEDAQQFLLNVDGELVDRWLGAPWIGTAADFNGVLNEHPRAWFVVDTIRLPVYYGGDWLALLKTQMELVWSGDGALAYRTRPNREPLPTAPSVRVDADLEGLIRLVGYTEVVGETSYRPIFFWTALSPISEDYTVFVHVRDSSGATVAQRDAQPLGGDYPTSQWRVGETVIDPFVVELPPDLPAGEYQILVGMYQLETLERLQVMEDTSGENVVVLGEVTLP